MKTADKPSVPPRPAASADTAALILDVAEDLFARHGYNGASIRDITSASGTNLGAVTYHFGTKESLLTAILERGAAALNRKRTERFTLLEQAGRPPSAEAVLRAFIEPTYELLDTPSGIRFLRIQNDISAERTDVPSDILAAHYDVVARHFMRLLATVAPHLSSDALAWNFQFILGALLHTLTQPHRFPVHQPGEDVRACRHREMDELVRFLAQALRAPNRPTRSTRPT
jgi:AcrR family transcriptional regulator